MSLEARMSRSTRAIASLTLLGLMASNVVTAPFAASALAAPKKAGKPTASAPASADDAPDSAIPDKATIAVSSMTRGAKVYLNDQEVGEVPLKAPMTVKAGETYSIRVQKRGYAPYIETVMAGGGQNSVVEADLVPNMGVLRIDCNVLRARVTLAGKPIGMTPFDGDVTPGKHELRVAMPGYIQDTRQIQIEAGQEQRLQIALAEVPAPVVEEDKSILGRWWFWTAVGAVVVGGVTAGVVATQAPKHVPAAEPDARLQLP